jgi:hypothetical protein
VSETTSEEFGQTFSTEPGDDGDVNSGFGDLSTYEQLQIMHNRLDRIEQQNAAIVEGVNTIGSMMNEFVDGFGKVMVQVQQQGIGSLLGGLMGGKKNG